MRVLKNSAFLVAMRSGETPVPMPVTPWESVTPEVSDPTARRELPKVGPITGVKSLQGSRIGRCGWITSFLRKKEVRIEEVFCFVMSVQKRTKCFWWRCAEGKLPYPSRTRWLRPERPMVLHWRRCGRVGGRQN